VAKNCDLRRRVPTIFDCRAAINQSVNYLRSGCPQNMTSCTDQCRMTLKNVLTLIGQCQYILRLANNLTGVDIGDAIVNFTRVMRLFCNVTAKNVVVNVTSDTEVDITSQDPLAPGMPRTILRILANDTLEWEGERYDNDNDTTATVRFRFRLKAIHEFRPRNGSDNDTDFDMYGADPNVDDVVQSYDFQNTTDTSVDAILDMGSVNIYVNQNGSSAGPNGSGPGAPTSTDTPSFRHVTRASLWYGPGKLARAILTFVATNIKNQVFDPEVTVPGGVSFNLLLDNIPFRFNDTSFFLEIIYDTDDEDGALVPNTTNVDQDQVDQSSGQSVQLQDNTEGQVQFNDTRKVRWKRVVYCDGNKTVVVRSRFVKAVGETPDGGYLVRRRLFITFHIAIGVRCSRLLWDPATDIETPADTSATSTTGSSSTGTTSTSSTGTSSSTGTATTSSTVSTGSTHSSNVATLVASFFHDDHCFIVLIDNLYNKNNQ